MLFREIHLQHILIIGIFARLFHKWKGKPFIIAGGVRVKIRH